MRKKLQLFPLSLSTLSASAATEAIQLFLLSSFYPPFKSIVTNKFRCLLIPDYLFVSHPIRVNDLQQRQKAGSQKSKQKYKTDQTDAVFGI